MPTNLSANWLGDEGASGNFFGVEPRFFNVVALFGGNVAVVVNQTSTTAGLGDPYHIAVEGFTNADFGEVPEPSAAYLCFAGLAALAWRRASRRISFARA